MCAKSVPMEPPYWPILRVKRCCTRPRLVLCAVVLAVCGGHAYADCAGGSKTLFSCSTAKEKRIEVCETRGMIEYSFGHPLGRPEIVVRVPRAQVSQSQWTGAVRWNFYAVNVPHGDTTYSIFWGNDVNASRVSQEGGVNVVAGGVVTATVLCSPDSIVQAMDTLSLAANVH